jgi:hypothetical protein
MVKLITEALIAQNAAKPVPDLVPNPDFLDDMALASLAMRRGDIERTALLYDQKTRLLAAKPEPLAPGPDVPMLLDKFSSMFNRKALDFVSKVFPPDQLDKLNNAYGSPPEWTAQILHPEYYTHSNTFRVEAVKWANEELHGAKPLLSGALGEAALTVWISRFSHDETTPDGWTGDRFAVWDGGADGDAWIVESHWKDNASAEQFFADTQKIGELMLHARLANEDKRPDTYTANSEKRSFRSIFRKDRHCVYVYCAKKEIEAGEMESQFVKP